MSSPGHRLQTPVSAPIPLASTRTTSRCAICGSMPPGSQLSDTPHSRRGWARHLSRKPTDRPFWFAVLNGAGPPRAGPVRKRQPELEPAANLGPNRSLCTRTPEQGSRCAQLCHTEVPSSGQGLPPGGSWRNSRQPGTQRGYGRRQATPPLDADAPLRHLTCAGRPQARWSWRIPLRWPGGPALCCGPKSLP